LETIHLDYPLNINYECPPTAIALGYFDGIHKGHQQVMNTALSIARESNMLSAVMTFHPHPNVVLGRFKGPIRSITPMEQKQEIIERMGFDRLYLVSFTKELATLQPEEFIDQFLVALNVKHVVAGFDYTYGHMGKGTMETMPAYAKNRFEQTTVHKVALDGTKISSTLIRNYILDGRVNELRQYLGRFYEVKGTVVDGDKRGRQIGFPTANIEINGDYLLPPVGVYAVKVKVKSTWLEAVCNVGYKPTFKDDAQAEPTIEAHIFNFDQDIYGEVVNVEWHKRLRSERKFNSVDELIAQINNDKEEAAEYFSL
jgi:riboflavin kinase/FMN adenylyltransferase